MKILLIDQNKDGAQLIWGALRGPRNCGQDRVDHEINLYPALLKLQDDPHRWDVIVLELCFPECQGLTTLNLVLANAKGVPVVVMSALESREIRAEALILGADDYIIKGRFTTTRLAQALLYASERGRQGQEKPRSCELCGRFRGVNAHATANCEPRYAEPAR